MTSPLRVCLIDDDILLMDALALGLRDAGFEVMTAPGAAAGLDLLQRRPAAAIVTDMHMPGTDGAALVQQARAQWPDIAIVAISGAARIAGRDFAEFASALGADAAMLKPFRASQLAATLEQSLRQRLQADRG